MRQMKTKCKWIENHEQWCHCQTILKPISNTIKTINVMKWFADRYTAVRNVAAIHRARSNGLAVTCHKYDTKCNQTITKSHDVCSWNRSICRLCFQFNWFSTHKKKWSYFTYLTLFDQSVIFSKNVIFFFKIIIIIGKLFELQSPCSWFKLNNT